MGKFQTRRAFLLWFPLMIAGVVLYAVSQRHGLMVNSLTFLSIFTVASGVGALAFDNREAT